MFNQAYEMFKEAPIGVEVGVFRGANAEEVTTQWPALLLHLVDNYVEEPNALEEAKTRLSQKNVYWMLTNSEAASQKFQDHSIDFVYLDGDHTFQGVLKDITNWLPKVRLGGLLGGHDYANKSIDGVRRAVNRYIIEQDLILRAIGEDWWIEC